MHAFRNVVFWFVGLMVITIAGFWNSYFSVLFDEHHYSHHLHGSVMTLWVVLLIAQAWLVRRRRFDVHRMLGRTSVVLAPLVVFAGIIVNFHFIGAAPDPTQPIFLGIYWFGWFLPLAFAVLYALAMVHRKDFQLHARYMIATGVIFLFPGFGRFLRLFVDFTFYEVQLIVFGVCIALIAWDRVQGRFRVPFIVLAAMWAVNLVMWHLLPGWAWWQSFSAWSASLAL